MSHINSIDNIKYELNRQSQHVAEHWFPAVQGSYIDGDRYFTINCARHDTSVGSFYITVSGPNVGRWYDFAIKQGGDLLDLIAYAESCDIKTALSYARAFLGMENETAEQRQAREERAKKAKAGAADRQRKRREERERTIKFGHRLWLSAQADLRNTPVDWYLRPRAIRINELGHLPQAIRYAPNCKYKHTDKKTGEVFEGTYPAMLTLMNAGPKICGVHRTYLQRHHDGSWGKAAVPKAKKILGYQKGMGINLWRGIIDGKLQRPLSQCPPETRVYLCEGIEDGLSLATLMPEARIRVTVTLGEMGTQLLPENVTEVTLVQDNDKHPDNIEAQREAEQIYLAQGRTVRSYRPPPPYKDVNEMLMAMAKANAQERA
ncbi:MAG: toprim domain-containing protein [Pseudomonadota bacterium]